MHVTYPNDPNIAHGGSLFRITEPDITAATCVILDLDRPVLAIGRSLVNKGPPQGEWHLNSSSMINVTSELFARSTAADFAGFGKG